MRWKRVGVVVATGLMTVCGGAYLGQMALVHIQSPVSLPESAVAEILQIDGISEGVFSNMLYSGSSVIHKAKEGNPSMVVTEVLMNTETLGAYAAAAAAASRNANGKSGSVPSVPAVVAPVSRPSADKPNSTHESPDGSCFINFRKL